ncbi:MAG TPA: hypothetical protein VFX18_03935 [Candidatus Nitrosocosmicus sp.]|nr:hypothetical protein [Candidatus Nitrosocosmicus sp.]
MTKLEIRFNDQTSINVEVEDYNPLELVETLNDQRKQMIVLGDVILQKYSIIRISPVKELNDAE